MDDGKAFGRGVAFPPSLGAEGRLAFSTGSQNIRESIRVILTTEAGERLMLPGFGASLRRFLFEPNTVATRRLIQEQVLAALRRWEPRVTVDAVAVEPDPEDARASIATISYTLVASQAREQISVRVQTGG